MEIKPIKTYGFPDYPTREFAVLNPELLRYNVPAVWKAKPLVAGTLAAFLLGGVTSKIVAQNTEEQVQVSSGDKVKLQETTRDEAPETSAARVAPVFVHGGGYGSIGCMAISPPVFLSEGEARLIIEDAMKKQKIAFDGNDTIKDTFTYEFEYKGETRKVKVVLDGYNEKFKIGYEFISREDCCKMGGSIPMVIPGNGYNIIGVADSLVEQLKKSSGNRTNVGVFYDPVADTKELSEELLRNQVQDFISWVKEHGILEAE
ncbi:hypothetical protein JXM67_10065 [candidate division WOR-3 bacterium]|nr:hypothetical protein [candidate division WOR-3 bacterium]